MNILFVCTGNTCRSPMAEALLRAKYPYVCIRSAGVFADHNGPMHPLAAKVLADRGIEFDHRTQPVDTDLLNWADVVLTMTTDHKQALIIEYPEYQNMFFTLKEYVNSDDKEVWDELRQSYAAFEDKRTAFIRKYEHQMDAEDLHQKLQQIFKADLEHINRLEAELTSYDLSDPFGGDIDVYKRTLAELEESIDRLVDNIKSGEIE